MASRSRLVRRVLKDEPQDWGIEREDQEEKVER
jgi:hypothetical protein